MANHKSSVKRARQTIRRTERNKARTSEVKSTVKAVRKAIEAKDKGAASELLKKAQSVLLKLAKIGVIRAENAGRKVSRLAGQVSKM